MSDGHLEIFAKYWEPGRVKTRLAASIGTVAASRLYRAFVVSLVDRFASSGESRGIRFWPPERRADFARLLPADFQLQPQQGDDLGSRLAECFTSRLATAGKLIVIGSDSPSLPITYIDRAWALLDSCSVVLGPSSDGGYYLVGARETPPAIFDQIPWSTPQVWEATTRRLDQLGVSYAVLPTWYDVDDLDDLRRLQHELREHSVAPEADRALLAAVSEALGPPSPSPAPSAARVAAQHRRVDDA